LGASVDTGTVIGCALITGWALDVHVRSLRGDLEVATRIAIVIIVNSIGAPCACNTLLAHIAIIYVVACLAGASFSEGIANLAGGARCAGVTIQVLGGA
jgi:hypothetical protein